MKKLLTAFAAAVCLIASVLAQDEPQKTELPVLILDEIVRPLTRTFSTPEEDRAYFKDKTTRLERERIVLLEQFRLSKENSSEDMIVAYRLTVRSSDGQCYGYCAEQTQQESEVQKSTENGGISELLVSEISIHVVELTTLEEESRYFNGETDRAARELLVCAYVSLETIRAFSKSAYDTKKVVVHMFRVHTPSGECYGECNIEEDAEPLLPKNEA